MKRIVIFSAIGISLLLIVAVFLIGLAIGFVVGEHRVYHRTFLEEQKLVFPIVNRRPEFDEVIIDEYSGGGIYMRGWVKSVNDEKALHAELVRVFGEARAHQLMEHVDVKEPAKDR